MKKTLFCFHVKTGNRGDDAISYLLQRELTENNNVPIAYFNIKYEGLSKERILKQLNTDASGLMIAGSGIYSPYNNEYGWLFKCAMEDIPLIEVPIFMVGLGMNGNLRGSFYKKEFPKETLESIKILNNRASFSSVRDANTYGFLQSLGINKHVLNVDPACFLKASKSIKKKKKVAIQLAQHAPILGRFDCDYIGLLNKEYNIDSFQKISAELIKQGYDVVFIAHDALERSIISELREKCPSLSYLDTDNIQDMIDMYASCEFSIGIKMHSNILSFAAGTPFISLYYDTKHIEFLKMVGMEKQGVNLFQNYLQELFLLIEKTQGNIEILSSVIRRMKDKYFPIWQDNIHDILSSL